jgi:hypothetical protein
LVSQLRETCYYAHHNLALGVLTTSFLVSTTHQWDSNQAFFWRHCRGSKKKLPRQPRAIKAFFGTIAGEKEDFCKGSLSRPIFYFVIVFIILFLLASFYQKYKKNSSFIVVIFTCLLLVLLEWVLLRTPSYVILLAPKTMFLSALLLRHQLLRQIFMRLSLLC